MHVCINNAYKAPSTEVPGFPSSSNLVVLFGILDLLGLAAPVVEGSCTGYAIAARRKGRGISIPFRTSVKIDDGADCLIRGLH